MRRLAAIVSLASVAACSRNPELGHKRTVAALNLTPDSYVCEPSGIFSDTCVVRFGKDVLRWTCDSDMCAPYVAPPPATPIPIVVPVPVR